MPVFAGKAPPSFGALDVVRVVVGAGLGVKEGWRTVEVVDEVTVRCAAGRRFAWLGKGGGGACVDCVAAGPST